MQSQFPGAWALVSVAYHTEDGQSRDPFSREAKGIIMYDASGWMSVQIMRTNRPTFPDAGEDPFNAPEPLLRAAFEGLNTYYGRYTVDPAAATVTHHLVGASLPNREGSDQLRYYAFDDAGQTLTLKAPPRLLNGERLSGVLVWHRLGVE